jgi:enamine deaminase RidA (YjgF/YER057c/UK114 family)
VDTGGGSEFGYWGEIMATAAQARGIMGLVITGGVRDSARLAQMRFPVFSETICIQGTGKNPLASGAVGSPVWIGSCQVHSGDLVFGDDDGVVVLPAASAAEAVRRSLARDVAELDILQRLRDGETTLSIYDFPPLDPAPLDPRSWRRSIEVAGLSHGHTPIPAASRVGPVVVTGGVRGVDRATGQMPGDVETQARMMFENLRAIIEAAGATCEDIAKLTVWVTTPDARSAINPPWLAMFPDPEQRPARHIMTTSLAGGMLVQCEAIAITQTPRRT